MPDQHPAIEEPSSIERRTDSTRRSPGGPGTDDTGSTRRGFLQAAGAGLAGSLFVGRAAADEHGPTLEDQLATARQATAKYRNPAVALRDGFRPVGPNVPGNGWHFVHPGRLGTAAAEGPSVDEPQVLTYADTGSHLVLGAAEYAVPLPNDAGYTAENPPDLFAGDGGHEGSGGGHEHGSAAGRWHVHGRSQHLYADGDGSRTPPSEIGPEDLLTAGRWTEFPIEDGEELPAPGDTVTADWGLDGETESRVVDLAPDPHPDLLTLHAWVHIPNPDGTFGETNPNVDFVERLPDSLFAAHAPETVQPGGGN